VKFDRAAIESLAETTRIQSGFTSIPVNVEAIAPRHNAHVVLENFSEDISGILVRKGDTAMIAVNASDSPLRRRFTVAHELGHLVLSHKGEIFVDKHVVNKRASSGQFVDPQEIEANQFAASLLMPREELVEHFGELVERHRNPVIITELLASTFKVSRAAMGIRLVNLGLMEAPDDRY
jgi:Zn-dependent peptidase ImmA (M78 family)